MVLKLDNGLVCSAYGQLPWNMMPTAESSLLVGVSWLRRIEARQWKEAEENVFHCIKGYVMLCYGLNDLRFEFDNAWWIDDAGDGAVEAIVLGFQHYLTMVGTAVLIPLLIFQTDSGATPVSFSPVQLSSLGLGSVTGTIWRPVEKFANFQR